MKINIYCCLSILVMCASVPLNYCISPYRNDYSPKGILIFLDDSEVKIGPLSSGLLIAISQKAGPFIVSTSLLRAVFSEYKEQFPEEDIETLKQKFIKGLQFMTRDVTEVILRALAFNSNEWVIKKVNDSLCLLMPHTYLHAQGVSISAVQQDAIEAAMSETELKLGLKVNHMETVHIENVIESVTMGRSADNYFMKA